MPNRNWSVYEPANARVDLATSRIGHGQCLRVESVRREVPRPVQDRAQGRSRLDELVGHDPAVVSAVVAAEDRLPVGGQLQAQADAGGHAVPGEQALVTEALFPVSSPFASRIGYGWKRARLWS